MKKRILCFGDSNTWGHDPASGARFDEDTRWTGILQNLLGSDYTVIEEGMRGRTTVWDDPVDNRISGVSYLWPCLDSHAPVDLVIIMLGSNDLKIQWNLHPKSVALGVGRLVEMTQKCYFGPNLAAPQVLLVSPIHMTNANACPYFFDETSLAKSRQLSGEYREIARQTGCHFLDAAQHAAADPAEGIHLNPEGHKNLAKALYKKITEIL